MLSRIFHDLLNPNGSHGQGRLFLEIFLQYLELDEKQCELWKSATQITIFREEQNSKSKTRRSMDIYLSAASAEGQSLGLCIENKPFAADQNKQLIDYARELQNRHGAFWHMVYLSSHGQPPASHSAPPALLDQWLQAGQLTLLSYRDVSLWLQGCAVGCQNDRVRLFVLDMVRFIEKKFGSDKK